MRSQARLVAAGLLLSAALLGCAGRDGLARGMCRVNGTVVLKDKRDLSRLKDCMVVAQSVADPSLDVSGAINDADGSFDLCTTRKEGDRFIVLEGIPAGEYRVRIEASNPRSVPARYQDFEKSGLKFKATDSTNDIKLEINPR